MKRKSEKTDEQISAEITKQINARLDHIEVLIEKNEELYAQRLQLKDWEIHRLKREIAKLKRKK